MRLLASAKQSSGVQAVYFAVEGLRCGVSYFYASFGSFVCIAGKNVLMVVLPMFVVVIVGQDVTSLAPTARNPESSLSPKPETLIPKPLPDFDLGSSILPLTSEPIGCTPTVKHQNRFFW